MAIKAIDCTWATKGVTIAPILAIILQEPRPIALIDVGYTYNMQKDTNNVQVIFFPNCNKLITEILSFIKADYVTSNKLLNAFIYSNYSIMQKSNKWKFTVKRSTVPLGFFFLNKLNSPQVCKHRLPGMLLI